jgi:protein-L-isoaspartate(D-aspartate) O-methyltransferase
MNVAHGSIIVITLLMALPTAPGPRFAPSTGETQASQTPDTVATDHGWEPPQSPLIGQRVADRERMVRTQIEQPPDHRVKVTDPAVLRAMRAVPRHAFVPDKIRSRAYSDTPLPIGHGQTISQPYIVAAMTELLDIDAQSRVLEIGTGSGYQAAVLAQLTPHVFSVEIIDALAERAHDAFGDNGYDVRVRNGDGYFGWAEHAPFDAIIVTCAAGHLPPPLWEQLKPGGRIVIPIGGTFSVQRLVVVAKDDEGRRSSRTIMGVRFVPMTGRAMETDD